MVEKPKLLLILFVIAAGALADDKIVPLGKGSYALQLPAGAKFPQAEIYATENVRGKMPTNDWWSSAAWLKFSERMYPHPLAVQAEPLGLRVYYPGANITANNAAIFGFMPDKTGDDLILGHSEVKLFDDARVDGFSDWFVSLKFAAKDETKSLRTTFGHGSPFVYATWKGGSPTITFAEVPRVWAGDAKPRCLASRWARSITASFGPTGSTLGMDRPARCSRTTRRRRYFSLAVLPDDRPETLAHVHSLCLRATWTTLAWRGHTIKRKRQVHTDYAFTTKRDGRDEQGTLFASIRTSGEIPRTGQSLSHTYPSVRGAMKLAGGIRVSDHDEVPRRAALPANDGGFKREGRSARSLSRLPTMPAWRRHLLGRQVARKVCCARADRGTARRGCTPRVKRHQKFASDWRIGFDR